jgi:hypothetical protein
VQSTGAPYPRNGTADSIFERTSRINAAMRRSCSPVSRDSGTEQLIASTTGASYRRANPNPNPAIPTTVSSRSTE